MRLKSLLTPPLSSSPPPADPDASSEESVSAGEDQEAEAPPPADPPKEGEEPVAAEAGEKGEAGETAEKPPEEPAAEPPAEKSGSVRLLLLTPRVSALWDDSHRQWENVRSPHWKALSLSQQCCK